MLNELGNYWVPDLNTLLFGIPTSDFNTNGLSVEDGFSLSLSLSLSLLVLCIFIQ